MVPGSYCPFNTTSFNRGHHGKYRGDLREGTKLDIPSANCRGD